MTQANTKDWCASSLKSLRQVRDSDGVHNGITGAVGDEETVVFGIGVEVIVPGNDLDFNTTSNEAADLVVFLKDIKRMLNSNSNAKVM